MNEFSIDAACAGYDELYHHGIPNQRWGVRNGPPYPLDQKRHRRVVSGKQDKEIKKYDTAITGRTQFSSLSEQRKYSLHKGDRDDKTVDQTPLEYLTDDLMSQIKTLGNKGKISQDPFGDVEKTNPNFSNARDEDVWRGANNNCVKCTSALALRALGYDVIAGLAPTGLMNNATQRYWDGARPYKERGADNLEKRMKSFGKRGMGEFSMRFENGSGHSMYFQNERQPDGSYAPVIYDGQNGRVLGSVATALAKYGFDTSKFGQITRLDDATPNLKAMAEDSVFAPRVGKYNIYGGGDRLRVAWDA